ncbi:hypothetical protein SAMN05216474_0788 [Lishizhenia tianjinensis]|uniref:Uncharacterized protein n=1 Tax=Lishizhenia tianjinensis TaxID=477690 RepID=A0A1I6YBJ3_9FLAO|nr:hypothetical protein SAMN05216474_0788 [Lishizhenia tianjinensis]
MTSDIYGIYYSLRMLNFAMGVKCELVNKLLRFLIITSFSLNYFNLFGIRSVVIL